MSISPDPLVTAYYRCMKLCEEYYDPTTMQDCTVQEEVLRDCIEEIKQLAPTLFEKAVEEYICAFREERSLLQKAVSATHTEGLRSPMHCPTVSVEPLQSSGQTSTS